MAHKKFRAKVTKRRLVTITSYYLDFLRLDQPPEELAKCEQGAADMCFFFDESVHLSTWFVDRLPREIEVGEAKSGAMLINDLEQVLSDLRAQQ